MERQQRSAGDDALAHAWDEYKLLQDKVDRLGDFRFRAKQWLTLIPGALVASFDKWPWPAPIVGIAVVAGVFVVELEQVRNETACLDRLAALEVFLSGGVAGQHRYFPVQRAPSKGKPGHFDVPVRTFSQALAKRRKRWFTNTLRALSWPSWLFYGLLVVGLAGLAVLRSQQACR